MILRQKLLCPRDGRHTKGVRFNQFGAYCPSCNANVYRRVVDEKNRVSLITVKKRKK